MTRIAAALIDLDGTLVDSNEFHVLSWREAFLEQGHEFPPDVIRRQIGKGADQLIPTLLPGASADEGAGKRGMARSSNAATCHKWNRWQGPPSWFERCTPRA